MARNSDWPLFKPQKSHYVLNGKHRTPDGGRVTKATAGAELVMVESDVWWGVIFVGPRRKKLQKVCLNTTNKEAARVVLAKRQTDAALEQEGLLLPSLFPRLRLYCEHCFSSGRIEGQACPCPGEAHLTDYRRHLEAEEDTPRYISQVIAHCQRVFEAIDANYLADVDAAAVESWLQRQRRQHGMSISTRNHYVRSLKAFYLWLKREVKRIRDNPLEHLRQLNEKTDVRHKRRELVPDEVRRLAEAALQGAKRFRALTGRDRYHLYFVAFQTGFRARELASLQPGAFDLDGRPPAVVVGAAYSKRRREDRQPIPPALAEMLRPYLAGKKPGKRVWPGSWSERAYEMIELDLAAAKKIWVEEAKDDSEQKRRLEASFLSYTDAQGRVADFHSLRHGFITTLTRGGVHPKQAQALARHSSITLTMDYYTHTSLEENAQALDFAFPLLPVVNDPEAIAERPDAAGAKAQPAKGIPGDGAGAKESDARGAGPNRAPDERRRGLGGSERQSTAFPQNGPSEPENDKTPGNPGVSEASSVLAEGWVRGLEPPTFRSTVFPAASGTSNAGLQTCVNFSASKAARQTSAGRGWEAANGALMRSGDPVMTAIEATCPNGVSQPRNEFTIQELEPLSRFLDRYRQAGVDALEMALIQALQEKIREKLRALASILP